MDQAVLKECVQNGFIFKWHCSEIAYEAILEQKQSSQSIASQSIASQSIASNL